jgi:arylsulfatase A-like enzyme
MRRVMAWLPLLSALLGCGSAPDPFDRPIPPRPAGFVDPDLSRTGAQRPHQLWLLEGRYTLPATTLPEGFTPKSRFPIQMETAAIKDRKATSLFRGESPFPSAIEDDARLGAPPGMALFVGDEEIPYNPNVVGKSWRINGDHVLVAWPVSELPPVSVTYRQVEFLLHRRDFGAAGLPPEEFVRYEVTLGERTRSGMILPAPGSAEWDLTLPERGATFETFLAMAPMPLQNLESDGATVVASVVVGGATTEVGRRFVAPGEDAFDEWSIDLSRWAGERVTVRLATEPYDTVDFDHVFLGAPTISGPPAPDSEVRRVIVIGLDTTRPDHFGFGYDRPTTPELDLVAGSSVVFDHTWTPAPRTRPSFRSAFTGRRPLDAVGAPNIAEIFQREGFATAGIVANIHLQPRFDFNDGFDAWWFDGKARADDQVDRALAWLRENDSRDAFLFLHFMDPHLFYAPPARHVKGFVTDPDPDLPETFSRWEVLEWLRTGRIDDRRKEHIRGLYDAELRFTSEELGRLFDHLDRLGGRTLVVLHSDHGEELFEHGRFEHNHTLYDETTRGLLWFRSGAGQTEGRRIPVPATLADIAPTLYDFLGLADPPPSDGKSLAPLLRGTDDGGAWIDREIPTGHLRYGKERWGVVVHGHKYILHTASGEEELYDLEADPTEAHDLAVKTPLAVYRAALARSHGMKVGRGWRVRVSLPASAPKLRFELPLPAKEVGVIDPEATTETPANEEWGERPKRTLADVGSVVLAPDGRSFEYTPGTRPDNGLLYVLYDADVDPSTVAILRDGAPLVTFGARGNLSWKSGQDSIVIEPGTVVVPPLDEATRIRLAHGEQHAAPDDAMREQLEDLGYLEPEDDDEAHAPKPAPQE